MDFSNTSMKELAGIIANHLSDRGIDTVLVGGLAVEIYSHNLYLTKDIDMVNTSYTPTKILRGAMAELGYIKRGRVYVNDTTSVTVEFPSAPLSVGDELITQTTTVSTNAGDVPILMVEDVVKDRLAAFIHWRDTQSLVQATAVMLKHLLKPESYKDFIEREGTAQHYSLLQALYTTGKQGELNMQALETRLADLLLQQHE